MDIPRCRLTSPHRASAQRSKPELAELDLDALLAQLRSRGSAEVFGQCLPEHQGMAALARDEGFQVHMDADRTVHLRLRLPTPH